MDYENRLRLGSLGWAGTVLALGATLAIAGPWFLRHRVLVFGYAADVVSESETVDYLQQVVQC